MKKLLLSVLILLLLAGCSSRPPVPETDPETTAPDAVSIWYLDAEEDRLISRTEELSETDDAAAVQTALNRMQTPPEKSLRSAWPNGAQLRRLNLKDQILTLSFAAGYEQIDRKTEILFRAALVRTLTQIEGISGVQFQIGEQPLTDAGGSAVGIMNGDQFLDAGEENVSREQVADLVLYFTDSSGQRLVPVTQKVRYSADLSPERAAVIQLLKGPSSPGAYPTLSSRTQLLEISVRDGICYVDFDEGFLDDTLAVADYIPIYSVVDTLTAMGSVRQVRISVRGSTDIVFRGSIRLNTLFEQNLDYIGD